jgi:signal transduction histidine kinase
MTSTRRTDGATRQPATVLAGSTALAAALGTLGVVALPFVSSAYPAPALHVILETVNAVAALLVMYLVYGRFKQDGRLQEVLLSLALGAVAVANLVLTAVPDALTGGRADELSNWAPLTVRLLGTALFTGAALTPAAMRERPRAAGLMATGVVMLLVALGVAGVVWGDLLPTAVDSLRARNGLGAHLLAHPAVVGAQAASIVLYGVAATAFARQSDRTRDELLRWVAAGCVLASFAAVHYLLFPSLYSEYVYSGDLLRLGFYLFLLVGAAREITSFWQMKAQTAVLEDRRRIARDLHDGVIQELSYIYAQSRRLTAHPGDLLAVQRIGGAAGRAIDESRRALAALTRPDDADLPVVLRQASDELSSRHDVKVIMDLDPDAEGDGPIAEALLRILGEAVANGVRHGGATRVDVCLRATPLSLTIHDNGRGFPAHLPHDGGSTGFGLTSMRERASTVGATLAIDSEPGKGTTVRVSWV